MSEWESIAVLPSALAVIWTVFRPTGRRQLIAGCVAAALTAVQLAAGGRLWQLLPVYVLLVATLAAWLWQTGGRAAAAGPQPRRPERTQRRAVRLLRGSGVAAAVAGVMLSAVALWAFPVVDLPAPTGPYRVGTTGYTWSDRAESLTVDPADRRYVGVQLWYPAVGGSAGPTAPYLEHPEDLAALAGLLHLPAFVFSHLSHVATASLIRPPFSRGTPAAPVVLCTHGRGGYAQENTMVAQELASYGYVVACLTQPYAASGATMPDGHIIALDPRMLQRPFVDATVPYLAGDVRTALDGLTRITADPGSPFYRHLDLDQVGMFGLSLGGEVTLQACLDDPRLRACAAIDTWTPQALRTHTLTRPTLFLTRDAATMRREGWLPADVSDTLTSMRDLYGRLRGCGYFVTVPGMYHADFSDEPLLTPLAHTIGLSGTVPAARATAVTGTTLRGFFDEVLRDRNRSWQAAVTRLVPSVTVEHLGGCMS